MKLAAAAKPAVIALLALALFVPVNMIQGLVLERQAPLALDCAISVSFSSSWLSILLISVLLFCGRAAPYLGVSALIDLLMARTFLCEKYQTDCWFSILLLLIQPSSLSGMLPRKAPTSRLLDSESQ